jgi:chromosome partitioning protein
MKKIIAVSNHKGGVGKTTSTVNIGAALVKNGYKVLLVDLDPQANLTQSLGIVSNEMSIYDYIKGSRPVFPLSIKKNFFIVPSSLDLSAAEVEISSEPGREYILRDILSQISNNFDYILIDCPPSLSVLTINAFTTSDLVMIPVQAEYLPMRGLAKLTEVVQKIQQRLNSNLKIGCVFLTLYDNRKILNRDIAESIKSYFGDKLLDSKISNSIALAEAPTQGKDIFAYNKSSKSATEYEALTNEIIEKVL